MGAVPAIEVIGLKKVFGERVAVSDLALTVHAGEILGLAGPNGAGKTTTLRMLAGVLRPTAGEIRVQGVDVVKSPAQAKKVLALVPDTPHPYELLTVREHLEFVALAHGVSAARDRTRMLLDQVGLESRSDDLAASLSRGQQQRLAICCAFLHDPSVLLLDEPLTGLDPRGIREMRAAIRQRVQRGAAAIVSSHQLELVERLCDRLLILAEGRVLANGTLEEIRNSTELQDDASLEDVFFHVTEGQNTQPEAHEVP